MRVGSMQARREDPRPRSKRGSSGSMPRRANVESGELAYGSVTMVQHGVDEETGGNISSFLWSFSLTNNPALVDIPRIAASRSLPPLAVKASHWFGGSRTATAWSRCSAVLRLRRSRPGRRGARTR